MKNSLFYKIKFIFAQIFKQMKKLLVFTLLFYFTNNTFAQNVITTITPNSNDSRVITTVVPFVLIGADPRAAGLADMGVATSADAFSQQWNH